MHELSHTNCVGIRVNYKGEYNLLNKQGILMHNIHE